MKKIKRGIIVSVALLFVSALQTFAASGLGIKTQGTNIVVFWPSAGYENYVIQFRPSLGPSTPWTTLQFATPTNIPDNYPPNGTNVTTYTNFGAVPPPSGGGTGGSGGGSPPVPMAMTTAAPMEQMTMLNDGTEVPLFLYPPGFDTSELKIIEVAVPESQPQGISSETSLSVNASLSPVSADGSAGGDSPSPLDL